jgi:hypothetical protein
MTQNSSHFKWQLSGFKKHYKKSRKKLWQSVTVTFLDQAAGKNI